VERLAGAMHAAHTQDVMHRDLKPANVLFTADGQPKIADFGLSKRLDTSSEPQKATEVAQAVGAKPSQEKGIG
jgi:serine/threonine-protein kinase